jgi:hypothetical protein
VVAELLDIGDLGMAGIESLGMNQHKYIRVVVSSS